VGCDPQPGVGILRFGEVWGFEREELGAEGVGFFW
jgi:hypothetical protein